MKLLKKKRFSFPNSVNPRISVNMNTKFTTITEMFLEWKLKSDLDTTTFHTSQGHLLKNNIFDQT